MTDSANTVRRSFSLDALRDHDVIEWLSRQDNTSEVIRAALRMYMGQPSQSDVIETVEDLKRIVGEMLRTLRDTDFSRKVVETDNSANNDSSGGKAENNLLEMVRRWDSE